MYCNIVSIDFDQVYLIDLGNIYMVITVAGSNVNMNTRISKNDKTPIVMVIPGLTSDSTSPVSFEYFFIYLLQPNAVNTLNSILSYCFIRDSFCHLVFFCDSLCSVNDSI